MDLAAAWGREVIHVFDQGFASAFWLGLLLAYSLRFVVRWRKDYQLMDAAGNRRLTCKIAASANAAGRNAPSGMRDVLAG